MTEARTPGGILAYSNQGIGDYITCICRGRVALPREMGAETAPLQQIVTRNELSLHLDTLGINSQTAGREAIWHKQVLRLRSPCVSLREKRGRQDDRKRMSFWA